MLLIFLHVILCIYAIYAGIACFFVFLNKTELKELHFIDFAGKKIDLDMNSKILHFYLNDEPEICCLLCVNILILLALSYQLYLHLW